MEDWMGDAEIHFDKCHGGGRQTSLKRWGKGLAVGCCWSFQSDFTNEIADCTQQQKTLPCQPLFPSFAFLCHKKHILIL